MKQHSYGHNNINIRTTAHLVQQLSS